VNKRRLLGREKPSGEGCRPDGFAGPMIRGDESRRQETDRSPRFNARYLRLIGRKSRVSFHVLEKEVSMTPATVTERRTEQTTDKTAIRPFRFKAPEAELDEMRRRITATRFPEKEPVADPSRACNSPSCKRSRASSRWTNASAKGAPTEPGFRIDNKTWPHGGAARGIPHGAVFSRPLADGR
jgi:hypothetical protein